MKFLKKNWSIILLLLVIAGSMFILNLATLISPDDYSYAMTIAGDDLKITSPSEILSATKYLYLSWTGRILPHILVGTFMTTSITLFKILNTVMFIVLLLYTTKFLTKKTDYLSLITAFGFFVYGTMFGEKFAWISGSLNYLWTAVPLMIFLYNFYGYFAQDVKLKKWQKIVLAISGLLVGLLHEVTAFVGGAFLAMLFFTQIKKVWKSENKTDRLFFIGGIAFFGIGTLITILAPGNFVRNISDPTEKGSMLDCLGNYRDIKIQLVIMVISIIAVGILKKKELVKTEIVQFLLPVGLATIPFAFLGYFTPRSFVTYECLMIVVTVTNIQTICEYFNKYKHYKKVIVGIACIVTIIAFTRFWPSIYGAGRYILPYKIKMTKQLEVAQENGEKDVVVSKFLFTDKIAREKMINADNFFLDIDRNAVVNTYMALYYKFDCIHAISDIDYLVEIETDLSEPIDYGIINKDTLELIGVINASNKLTFTIPKDQFGTYVVDCRDKDLRSHVKSVRVRSVTDEMKNPNIEDFINQE